MKVVIYNRVFLQKKKMSLYFDQTMSKLTVPALLFFCLSNLLPAAGGYVIVNSVSWAVTNEVEEELDSSSTETIPALLEETSSIWKQSYPASVYNGEGEGGSMQRARGSKQVSFPSRMFSYRKEGVRLSEAPLSPHEELARTARYLAHSSTWGFLAAVSSMEKIKGVPLGNIFCTSDGPIDNSTGIPFFYVSPKDITVTDLRINSAASLTFSEVEGNYCRQNVIDPEDPRCVRLTLVGHMVVVPREETEFAKQAVFSRHPTMKKWPSDHDWFFMKMNIEQVWLRHWLGSISPIHLEDYFKASVTKA
ncbi:protein CREG2 [Latimeria chalumnae]|uniref:Cellular repressor of E1A stimulateds 2 n=1 Tax=Latimeria chalumnae TaxID=7897 RepID=H3AU48_LATCH|nr:PREDICTED: protein CREG2 [Latimeria chalumnae]|eukprot:XP_006002962.1 PREDICTED: protein CREG2 [Latimeria chalumnae]